MANGVNDHLVFRRLVEDEIRVRSRVNPPDAWIVSSSPDIRARCEKFYEFEDASLNATRALR